MVNGMGLFFPRNNKPDCPDCGAAGYEIAACLSCHTRGIFNGATCEECSGTGFRMTPCESCGGGGNAIGET